MNKIIKILIILVINILFFSISFANTINFAVTPIKQRIELNPWQTFHTKAKIRNKSNQTTTLEVWVYDLQAKQESWKPTLLTRKNEIKYPEQTLANWVVLDQTSLTLAPNEEKTVTFSINIPNDAVVWGHYWAIVFKKYNAYTSWSTKVNVFYGSSIILTVKWDNTIDWNIWDVEIDTKHSWLWVAKWIDNCPLGDFTKSNYDWKCVDIEIIDKYVNKTKKEDKKTEKNKKKDQNKKEEKNQKNNNEEKDENSIEKNKINNNASKINKEIKNISSLFDKKNFKVDFKIPIENLWNTQLHPKWKIVLKDEKGNVLKNIWKKIVVNEKWVVKWFKIVDYLPINDSDWDVFPKKRRIFDITWKGFLIKDEITWKIKEISPWEYFSSQNILEEKYLMPWERKCSKLESKKISAFVDVYYKNQDWKKIAKKIKKDFKIVYVKEYIWYNYYVIALLIFIIFILFLLLLLLILNKKRCINKDCKKKIKKDMKVCPYCWTIQSWKNKGKKANFKK